MALTKINAAKQIREQSISLNLLTAAIQAEISDVSTLRSEFVATMATRNQANGFAGLGADGTLLPEQIPSLSIIDTSVVTSEAEMLALDVQKGDLAIRTDTDETFILQGTDATVLSHWVKILSPVDGVQIVNGKTGANITLVAADIGYNNSGSGLTATTIQAALDELAADLASRDAAGTRYDNSDSGLTASNVQDAIDEVEVRVDTLESSKVSLDKLQLTPIALTGAVDGVNTDFTVSNAFVANTLCVLYNGQALMETDDYTVSGTTVTLGFAPETGDKVAGTFVKV